VRLRLHAAWSPPLCIKLSEHNLRGSPGQSAQIGKVSGCAPCGPGLTRTGRQPKTLCRSTATFRAGPWGGARSLLPRKGIQQPRPFHFWLHVVGGGFEPPLLPLRVRSPGYPTLLRVVETRPSVTDYSASVTSPDDGSAASPDAAGSAAFFAAFSAFEALAVATRVFFASHHASPSSFLMYMA
jgi:hypothetical protein